jgi:hypothetical protein
MVHSNLGGVRVPALNKIVTHITVPGTRSDHPSEYYEKRIREHVGYLRELYGKKPWYHFW